MRRAQFLSLAIVVLSCVVIWVPEPAVVYGGDLEPPLDAVDESGQPVPTMHTLDEIYKLIDERCPPSTEGGIPRTGQTTAYATGDDGDLGMGVAWPIQRFRDNGDGTVTDGLTGLIWLKKVNCSGTKHWSDALTFANSLYDGWTGDGSGGDCGLSDGSSANDWRLPNVRELHSLTHYGLYNPAVPDTIGTGQWTEGDPFTGLQSSYYWSSTTYAINTVYAWVVSMDYGVVGGYAKSVNVWVWPVRAVN
jgi:hypothetical protein